MEPPNHIGMVPQGCIDLDPHGCIGMFSQDYLYQNDSEVVAVWLHGPGRCCMVGSCFQSSADSTLSASLTNSHSSAVSLSSLLASMLVGVIPAKLVDTLSAHSVGTKSSPGHSPGISLVGSHGTVPLAGRLAS